MPAGTEGGTRGRLLGLLRRGPATITELADALGISDNAVRGHIAPLQRDGLVEAAGEDRLTGGKPAQRYQLTLSAEERFPKAYAVVLSELLRTLEQRQGRATAMQLLREVGRRMTPPANGGRSTIRARVELAADVLRSIGGDVDVARTRKGWELRGAGCPLAAVVRERPEACALAETLVAEITGRRTTERCVKGERPRCSFHVAAS